MRRLPVSRRARLDEKGYRDLRRRQGCALHHLAREGAEGVGLAFRRLENQFVVNLEQHARL